MYAGSLSRCVLCSQSSFISPLTLNYYNACISYSLAFSSTPHFFGSKNFDTQSHSLFLFLSLYLLLSLVYSVCVRVGHRTRAQLSSVISLPYFLSFSISFLVFFFPVNLLASLQIADSFSMQKEDVSKCHKAEG